MKSTKEEKQILRQRFGKELRVALKSSGVAQQVIAQMLEISPSAVSQMLKGTITPNAEKLEKIGEIIGIDRYRMAELRRLRMAIWTGDGVLHSPFNRLLRDFRFQRGLTVAQLARRTGIAATELRYLEECPEAVPTSTQCQKLAEVLECLPDDLWQAVNCSFRTDNLQDGGYQVNEMERIYRARAMRPAEPQALWVPLVTLEDLSERDVSGNKGFNLSAFAQSRSMERLPYFGMGMPAAVVRCSGDRIGWEANSQVTLWLYPVLSRSKFDCAELFLLPTEERWVMAQRQERNRFCDWRTRSGDFSEDPRMCLIIDFELTLNVAEQN